jgi:HEAT repeat protein
MDWGYTRRGIAAGAVVFFMFISAPVLSAQESILDAYERNFIRASLSAKAAILQDAATDDRSPEFIGQLYEFALNFALRNAEILGDDPDMIALIVLAGRGAGTAGYKSSVDTLWKVFSAYHNSLTRVEILGALAVLGKDDTQITENLNQFLANQNILYHSGISPDYPALSACISALAVLGNDTSFPVLFSAMITGYPDNIVRETVKALGLIQGDYKQFLIDVIRKNPPVEKLAAFRAGMSAERFGPPEQGQLAETALEVTLAFVPGNAENEAAVSTLRYSAVTVLTKLQWTMASPLVIKHFYQVQTDVQNGAAPRERLVEAVNCLGAMGSSDAAQALALQLGLLNSQTEQSGVFDEAVTLAVVQALGSIGDKSAFDYLLYISYLPYPEPIQAAAREALARLKW